MDRHDFDAMKFGESKTVKIEDIPIGALMVRRTVFDPSAPADEFILFPPEQAADAEREVCRRCAECN